MTTRPKVAVLVPAAGRGDRMGGTRKQFRALAGRPILHRTLDVFDAHPDVDGIVVAVPESELASVSEELRGAGISKLLDVVAGGSSRQDSVASALSVLPDTVEIVLVHDAVRPFLDAHRIAAVVDAVRRFGAAALAVSVADTLRKSQDGVFVDTVPREGLRRMQTPQGFRRDWFEEAHERAKRGGYQATDDVALVQQTGRDVRIVEGTAFNIKITTPEDWVLAQAIWETIRAEAS